MKYVHHLIYQRNESFKGYQAESDKENDLILLETTSGTRLRKSPGRNEILSTYVQLVFFDK